MTFPTNIERWRSTVLVAVHTLLSQSSEWQSLVYRLLGSIDHLVDTILALIQTESSGDPQATGDNGNSIGLMQLNFRVGTPQNVGYAGTREALYDPQQNIFYGTKYFLTKLDRYEDLNKAILYYNSGSLVDRDKNQIPDNIAYLNKVLAALGEKKTSLSPPQSGPDSGIGLREVGTKIQRHLEAIEELLRDELPGCKRILISQKDESRKTSTMYYWEDHA